MLTDGAVVVESKTVVAHVADELARRVVSGAKQPGELMPSVRQIAEEFGINRSTAQLVLGRLESHGFVVAQRARGFVIRDIRRDGGVEVYRQMFRLSMQMPETAITVFHDIVDVERSIVMDALLVYTNCPDKQDARGVNTAIEALDTLARSDDPDREAMLEIELAIIGRILDAVGQTFHRAILNSIGEMVLGVPEAVAAYYAVAPDLHVLVWRGLAAVWDSGGAPSEAQSALLDDLFSIYHERVMTRFEELVGAVGETAPVSGSTSTRTANTASA
ncbi:MAG TPA: GntR family transcriptional regulator [Mycobacterium sp.]|nr:GntR family transcriptional regulator [Mycobacterium sp.]